MSTLIAVLNSAVEDELIPSNPAARLGRVVRAEQAEVDEVEAYTHFVPRGDRRAVDALDDATGRNLYATAPDRTEVSST